MIIVEGITDEELSLWRVNPITEKVLGAIHEVLNGKRGDLGRGTYFSKDNSSKTQAVAFEGAGYCAAMNDVLSVEAGSK